MSTGRGRLLFQNHPFGYVPVCIIYTRSIFVNIFLFTYLLFLLFFPIILISKTIFLPCAMVRICKRLNYKKNYFKFTINIMKLPCFFFNILFLHSPLIKYSRLMHLCVISTSLLSSWKTMNATYSPPSGFKTKLLWFKPKIDKSIGN